MANSLNSILICKMINFQKYLSSDVYLFKQHPKFYSFIYFVVDDDDDDL